MKIIIHITIEIKGYLKNTARALGIYLASIERIGVNLKLDLSRLTKANPLTTIFDVGGNFGQTANRFALAFPSAHAVSFAASFAPFLYVEI